MFALSQWSINIVRAAALSADLWRKIEDFSSPFSMSMFHVNAPRYS